MYSLEEVAEALGWSRQVTRQMIPGWVGSPKRKAILGERILAWLANGRTEAAGDAATPRPSAPQPMIPRRGPDAVARGGYVAKRHVWSQPPEGFES